MPAAAERRVRPLHESETRTPLAWHHRNLNFQQQQQQQIQQGSYLPGSMPRPGVSRGAPPHAQHSPAPPHHQPPQQQGHQQQQQGARGRRPSSPSTTTSASSSSSSVSAQHATLPLYTASSVQQQQQPQQQQQATWDGEPCPVHHLPGGLGALLASSQQPPPTLLLPGMLPPNTTLPRPPAPPYSLPPAAVDKNMYMLLPPMLRPRPLVMPAAETTAGNHPEPLPVRAPKSINIFSTSKELNLFKNKKKSNCHGHTVVLWFIITIITIGIILAAVLRFVMG